MRRDKIKDLISNNAVIAKMYNKFKKEVKINREIIDMYSLMHMNGYVEEIDINGNKKTYSFYEE